MVANSPPKGRPSQATMWSGRQRGKNVILKENHPRKVRAYKAVLVADEKCQCVLGQHCCSLLPPAAHWTVPMLVLLSSEPWVSWGAKNQSVSTNTGGLRPRDQLKLFAADNICKVHSETVYKVQFFCYKPRKKTPTAQSNSLHRRASTFCKHCQVKVFCFQGLT